MGMTRYRHLLFDLDGTLTDPKDGITRSIQYALGRMGIEEPDLNKLTPFIGPPLQVSLRERYGFTPEQAWEAIGWYREYFTERGMFQNEVYPGIPQLLAELGAEGRKLIVATSKPIVYAKRILEHFGLDRHFAHLAGSELDGTRSDKADVIAYALELAGFPSVSACLMIGDRKHDIEGARAHGMDSVAVAYGYGTAEELRLAQPAYSAATVHSLAELLRG